ncbi:MAG: Gfo/Idh/MocA family oxidoreductase [Candidatus Tectomicrobia bacterium]|uniref:Gfo/Idh/MocA family oxidoreductase n=1 Tax=Tectimicrobiota bacterium TaxID=2528274 RepID=A0A932MNC4_UNCTE|nr:Gfo/Idh/MocA family oxidoreductase [Candidatus Tectomicrobia bacterium]
MALGKERIGIGVIGSGRIGSLRAHLAGGSPRVGFLAVSDIDPARARAVAQQAEAAFHTADNRAVIEHPEVDAVIVSTPEGDHAEAVCLALELGKAVLVEKPIALTLAEADRILAAQAKGGADLFVGYTQRLRRRFLSVKEHIAAGRLGEVLAGRLTIHTPRSVARQVYARAPRANPFTDEITYMADMALWFFEPRRPVRACAVAGSEVFPDHPDKMGDYGWGIVTFEGGAAASIGGTWILPEKWPAAVASISLDLFGSEGAIRIDDSHKDVMMVGNERFPSPYAPDASAEVAFLGSAMPGDWALGDFVGPMREETRLFLERVATGREVPLCGARMARDVLEVTLAMEKSAREGGSVVELPLEEGD